MIKYKGEEIGLQIIEQEESHTSKCSFLDEEPIGHSGRYLGKRIYNATCHGGLFRSFTSLTRGKIINADVQGAYNIIKKAARTAKCCLPKAFMNLIVIRSDGIEDGGQLKLSVGPHPLRINPLKNVKNINTIGD